MTTLRPPLQKLKFVQSNELLSNLEALRMRDIRVLRSVLQGASLQDCAQEYKVSTDRVRQIVRKMMQLLYFRAEDKSTSLPTTFDQTQKDGAVWLRKLDGCMEQMKKLQVKS